METFTDKELLDLVEKRNALFGPDGDHKDNEKAIDVAASWIMTMIRKHQDSLSMEVMLESMTHLGSAPSLIYDDSGHWTVGGDGRQPCMDTSVYDKEETEFSGVWWVPKGGWKPTIREAIKAYLNKNEGYK